MATLAAPRLDLTDMRDEDQEPTHALRRWTREEYDRMVEAGILTTRDKVQLIEGEIVEMSPQTPPHVATTHQLLNGVLGRLFPDAPHIRHQAPLAISHDSEPEPDIAVVPGAPRDYVRAHPTTALLLVEVSLSSLTYDRTTKARIYARARIPDYWIVNLRDRCVEVHRDPVARSGRDPKAHYASVTSHTSGETITPLAAPDATIVVADLLPVP